MSMQDSEYFKAHTDYYEAIWDCGGIAATVPYRDDDKFISEIAEEFDGFLFCGGSDIDPAYYGSENLHSKNICSARDKLEYALFNKVYPLNKPILGICRGMQAMNVFLGGTMIQHIDGHLQTTDRFIHEQNVIIKSSGKLYDIFKSENILTNSFHHQALDKIGNGLTVCAHSTDGIAEAVCAENHPFCIGVQWHPENFYKYDGQTAELFRAFVDACKK